VSSRRVTKLVSRARTLAVAVIAVACAGSLAATARASAPEIPASWVTDVSSTSAVLHAEINPNGEATGYHFEYISAAVYQANIEAGKSGFSGAARVPASKEAGIGAGTDPVAVLQNLVAPLNPLSPITAYRYRPVATNAADSTIGPEHLLATKEATNVSRLPDKRAWELVSPVDKDGGAIAAPGSLFGGGDLQAAAGGGAITYGSATSFGQAQGAPPVSQYLSRRGAGGWSTENVSAPLDSATYGDHPDGAPYRLFSGDLTTALLFGGRPCRGAPGCPSPAPPLSATGAPPGYATYYLRGNSGTYASLLSSSDLAHSTVTPEHFEVSLAATTPDLSHAVLSSCAALSADATEVSAGPGECSAPAQNLYEWSGGGLALLNRLPAQAQGTPGAQIAAPVGAISADGSRVYFKMVEDGALYLREVGKATVLVEDTAAGGASFQTASADGSVAFFTKAGNLYRFDAATQASALLAQNVKGVLGASEDGSSVYFQDATGLKVRHEGATTLVASGAEVAAPGDYPPATATARVSADGAHLAFLSAAQLPPTDNHDAQSGAPDTELYLYGPPPGGGAALLICASCNPTGERPHGDASIPGTLINGTTITYRPRVLSASGDRLFFDSADTLANGDTDSRSDVYQWEAQGVGDCTRAPGCVGLISGGRGEGGSFLDASADGADVYFLTGDSLVGGDPGSIDVYDARSGGGLPEAPRPIVCTADACQALPSAPEDPTPGTVVPNAGNPPLSIAKERDRSHKRRHKHRHRLLGGRR
jgi:hypothetical protein